MANVRSAARALLGSLDGAQADSAETFESRLRTAWKNSGKGEKTAEENLERMLDKVCVARTRPSRLLKRDEVTHEDLTSSD